MILSRHDCPIRDIVTTPANIGLSRCHDVTLESAGCRGGENLSPFVLVLVLVVVLVFFLP